jgi:triosephosphate isomerase
MVDRRPLIAGNWKMNFDHLRSIAFVQKLGWTLKDAKYSSAQVEVAVFPPFTDIRSVQTTIEADRMDFAFGAQDLSASDSGAHTGDISGEFLAKLGCTYVIVGHSERRSDHGEDDTVVTAKTAAAIRHRLVPIICVGETRQDRDAHGASAVPVAQLRTVIDSLSKDADIVVAYEPVWAIGSGQAATPGEAQEVCAALRDAVQDVMGEAASERTRILYGGSVKSQNIASFMREKDIDGALVGGASIDVDEFSRIVQFPKHIIA